MPNQFFLKKELIQKIIASAGDVIVSAINKTLGSTTWQGGGGGGGGGGITDGDYGDITVGGGGTTMAIDNGAVTLAKQADMATASVVYRKTAGSGAPEVQTLATLKTDLGLTGTNNGDQTTIVGITGTKAQFDTAVTDGNILYVGDVTQYTDEMAQDAVGAMIDSSLTYVDGTPLLQRAALTGDVTASAGSNATTIATNAVTNAKAAQMATQTIKGRTTAGTGNAEDLTATQATAILNVFGASVKGLVPAAAASPSSAKYLSEDGTFTTPAEGTVSAARVSQSAGQSITTTLTAINFDTETFDTNTFHDNVTNNTRLTIPSTGYYSVTGIVNTDANAVAYGGIRLNGSTYIAKAGIGNAGASTANGLVITVTYYFSTNDYIELMGAFGTTQTTKSGADGTLFMINKITTGVSAPVNAKVRTIGFSATGTPTTGQQGSYVVFPVAATITGYKIVANAGTCTIKTWKIASGTSAPTIANVISTSGVSLSSGTAIISSTVTDFTTTSVAANDIFAFDLTAVSGVTNLLFELELTIT